MSLTKVWLQTLGDGLVRADQVTGIDAHQTPALSGKRSHWLLDVVLPTSTGSGTRGDWGIGVLHRTLVQTPHSPGDAPTALARLLAQLDAVSAAGVIVTSRGGDGADRREPGSGEDVVASSSSSPVRFRFTPFESPSPGRHTGAEYL